MKKGILFIAMLSLVLGAFWACSSDDEDKAGALGEACRGDKPVVCDPACNATTQWCDAGTCKDFVLCDPACDAATQYCDVTNGTCTNLPAACDPACTGTQYCDDGTCKETPEVEEPCDEGLVCNVTEWKCEAETTDGDEETVDGDEEVAPEEEVEEEVEAEEPPVDLCTSDDDCAGTRICLAETEGAAKDCLVATADEVECVEGQTNNACAGSFDFATTRYDDGDKCAPVPCAVDDDCSGLEACDADDFTGIQTFECIDNGGTLNCKRATAK